MICVPLNKWLITQLHADLQQLLAVTNLKGHIDVSAAISWQLLILLK